MLNSIHIGTVVANADYSDDKRGQYLGRVLVKIPGITAISKNTMTYKAAGSNAGGNLNEGLIKEVENSEKVWAYVLAPISGESSLGKYNRSHDSSTLSDSADVNGMYNSSSYSTVPATQFSDQSFDGHTEGPAVNVHAKVNPYGNAYVTSNYSDSGKGMFALPAINSKVLVGFINGSRGLPIVLGKVNAGSEMEQMYGAGEAYPDYPNIFENTRTAIVKPPTNSTANVSSNPTKANPSTAAAGQNGPSGNNAAAGKNAAAGTSTTSSSTTTTTSTNGSSTATTTTTSTSTIVNSQTAEERQKTLAADAAALSKARERQVVFKEYVASGLSAPEASRQTRADIP